MMLVQQAGPGALPLSNLAVTEFLPFFRRIEESVIYHGLSPVLVYWSTRDARWLLPEANQFKTLNRDAVRVSMFSEDNTEKQDEFCFMVHSQGISMVVYGHCSEELTDESVYQCVGSIDPHIVKRAFHSMMPVWQGLDLPESNRLEDARSQVGNPVTAPHFVSGIRNDWPVVKQRQTASVTAGLNTHSPPDFFASAAAAAAGIDQSQAARSAIKNPEMVVRPGAEVPFPQSAVALDMAVAGNNTAARPSNLPPPPPGPPPGAGGSAAAAQTNQAGSAPASAQTVAAPNQALPNQAVSNQAGTAGSVQPATLKQALQSTALRSGQAADAKDSPKTQNQMDPALEATPPKQEEEEGEEETATAAVSAESQEVYGDPSLLEEEFNFGELLNSSYMQPPTGTASGGNGKSGRAAERKKEKGGIDRLREVWTNITQEVQVFAPDAQRIIRDIVLQLRISSDLPAILDLATQELTKLSQADRGLIWQVVDDQLVVTNEFALNEHYCFKGANLGAQETTAIVSEFLSRFPDETGAGVIAIPDTMQDAKLRRMSPTLAALIELGDARARLVAQIRSRGIFHGFIELQQSRGPREWSEQDAAVLQSVSETLSLVVQQSFDLMRIEQDANEMKLVNDISTIFRESGGQRVQYTIEQAITLFADHTGFISAQVFLFNEEEGLLVPQISEKEHSENIPLAQKHNPFMQVFESGKLKTVNLEYSKRGDTFFGHDTAMIIPLMLEGEKLGVLGLWKRKPGSPMLRPQDRELALTVAGNLASIIRAEQANAQIRQQWARESLINSVSEQIQQSLKEVNPILQTLVSQLAAYFDLGLSSVSVYDSINQKFLEPQCAGSFIEDMEPLLLAHLAENLFSSQTNTLRNPELCPTALMLSPTDVKESIGDLVIELPESMNLTMVFPLRQGSNLKGALCMMSSQIKPPSLQDMRMIQDLLNRVAVVIEHKELFEKVEKQAITDALTGLYNRRYFEEQLNKELDRHQRFGHACSFIILDLDHFKSVNDTLDHLNGDIALKHTSAIVKKCVRDVDTVGRFGGEEFVVLLPESDENAAMVVAERICTSIRESTIETFKSEECQKKIQAKLAEGKINEATATRLGNGKVTASVGVATFPIDAQDKVKLLELADRYLFLAKGRGRNQVCSSKNDTGPLPGEEEQVAPPVPEKAVHVPQTMIVAPKLPQTGQHLVPPKMPERAASGYSPKVQDAISDLHMIAEHGILGLLGNVIKAVSCKDGYNDDRSPRAADYASRIAQALRLSKDHTTVISLAAVLNNLGKVIVDEEVLRKSGPLTEAEWQMIENAPSTAARILEPAKHLHRVATVVESHHEHWDGSGYPRGLKGEDIPLESRIIAVVDAYVAMTSHRPYRHALPREEAKAALQAGAGQEWDPRIVKLFLAILDKEAKQHP